MIFGCKELIELIMAFSRNELIEPNDGGPSKLIVKYSIMEWEVKNNGIAVVKHQLFTFGQSASATHQFIGLVGCDGLIGHISPIGLIELIKLISRLSHIISLGGTIVIVSRLDLLALSNQWLFGRCIIGLVNLLALSNQ